MKRCVPLCLIIVLFLSMLLFPVYSSDDIVDVMIPVDGMRRIIILNNAFEGLEATRQCYNAKEWHKCYNMGEIIDMNLWFTPSDDIEVSAVHIGDAYRNITTLGVFRGKYVSFVKDNPAYDYDLFVGPNQKESEDVWYKDYVVIGNEALVFMPEEGIEDLVTYAAEVGLVPATEFDFTSVSGKTVTLPVDKLVDTRIIYNEWGAITLICGDVSLTDVKSIAVKGLSPESKIKGEGVYRMIILLNADGVYGVDPPYLQNRAGTWYPTAKTAGHPYAGCYSVAELFDKYDVKPVAEVYVESYADGFGRAEKYDAFIRKYIGWHTIAEYITMGMAQSRKEDAVWNVGFYILDDEAFVYIPENGLNVAEALEKVGMIEATSYELVYADGSVETLSSAEVADLTLAGDSNLVTLSVKYIPIR